MASPDIAKKDAAKEEQPVTDWKAEALKHVSSPAQLEVTDLWLTLFWAALRSPKRSAVCEPYPPFLRNAEGDKDFIGAELTMTQIPLLTRLPEHIETVPPLSLRLLSWLQEPRKVKLRSIPPSEFPLRSSFSPGNEPHLVFEFQHTDTQLWDSLRRQHATSLAYHGSALHNWYSIISNGLSTQFCRSDDTIFGDGIYLSTDPAVAINFRRSARAWAQSTLGETLSCLLVAEFLHHPDSVSVSEADGPNARSMSGVEFDHRLPRSYVLVKNDRHVRARYLLVWRQSATQFRAKWWLLLLVYAFILLFIAVSKNHTRWLRRAVVQIDNYF